MEWGNESFPGSLQSVAIWGLKSIQLKKRSGYSLLFIHHSNQVFNLSSSVSETCSLFCLFPLTSFQKFRLVWVIFKLLFFWSCIRAQVCSWIGWLELQKMQNQSAGWPRWMWSSGFKQREGTLSINTYMLWNGTVTKCWMENIITPKSWCIRLHIFISRSNYFKWEKALRLLCGDAGKVTCDEPHWKCLWFFSQSLGHGTEKLWP